MSRQTAYTSRVRIERVRGPLRRAYLPAEEEPVLFGVHSEIAAHYGVDPDRFEPHATTLDYVVAAAGGWLTGTFGGALEARGVKLPEGALVADARGEVEADDKALVIRRIHVSYDLEVAAEERDVAERVHAMHARFCPVARSLEGSIDVTTELRFRGEGTA